MRLVDGIADVDDLDAFLAALDAVAEAHGVTVQAFDARYVVGADHLRRARDLADRAIERGENVARDRGVEILLYAAGRRQIDQALTMGVAEGRGPVVVLVDRVTDPVQEAMGGGTPATPGPGEDAEAAAAEAVRELLDSADVLGAYDEALVCAFFDVGEAERGVVAGDLADLVGERVALLDVEK